jgi:transcriptional regulator with XRE-family HTH domain
MGAVSDVSGPISTPAWFEAHGSKALGEFIRDLRGRARWSQAALADRAGVSRNHVGMIERGAIASPRLGVLCELARALGVSAATLALAYLRPPGSDSSLDALPARSAQRGPLAAGAGPVGGGDAVLLGLMVRDLRGRARMGQEGLAAAAGLNRSTLERIERGMTSDPELMTLVRIAHALTREVKDPTAVARATAYLVSVFSHEPGRRPEDISNPHSVA